MKSHKDKISLPRLLQDHAMTPLEERVLAMRHGVVAALQTRLADASHGDSELSASLRNLEQAVLHRAAQSRADAQLAAARKFPSRRRLYLVPKPKA